MRRPVCVKRIRFDFAGQRFFPCRVTTVAMLPSALSRSDSFRSVHVGRSRFSRCCHLFGAYGSGLRESNLGQAINAVTGTRLWLLFFSSWNGFALYFAFELGSCWNCNSTVVVQRLVHFSTPPEVMQ
jgi:hypothetical protein